MKQLKKMNLSELKKLNRSEMKAIMAGSGTPGSGCKTLGQACGAKVGITYCCDGYYCVNGRCQ